MSVHGAPQVRTQTCEQSAAAPRLPGHASGGQPVARRFIPQYDGPVVKGGQEVLSRVYGDVVGQTTWAKPGYTLLPLTEQGIFTATIARRIHAYLQERAKAEGLSFASEQALGAYHLIEGLTDAAHLRIAKWGVPFELFGIDAAAICGHISDILGRRMRLYFIDNDPTVKDICGMRIIRPKQQDHNPFHRDGWFPALRNAVTLWVPVANCSAGSSLRVFAGSHLWPESDLERTPEGAVLGKRKFNVPALISLRRSEQAVEPLTQSDKGLLFSSFLLHGGGENRQQNKTRISFELRFIADS